MDPYTRNTIVLCLIGIGLLAMVARQSRKAPEKKLTARQSMAILAGVFLLAIGAYGKLYALVAPPPTAEQLKDMVNPEDLKFEKIEERTDGKDQ